jgi:hypothetical protein
MRSSVIEKRPVMQARSSVNDLTKYFGFDINDEGSTSRYAIRILEILFETGFKSTGISTVVSANENNGKFSYNKYFALLNRYDIILLQLYREADQKALKNRS